MGNVSIFKNSIYKMTLNAFNIFIPLLVTPYIASLFDRDEATKLAYGAYNHANSVFSIFFVFAAFGVYNFGVREISRARDDKKKLATTFTNLFFFSTLTSALTSVVFFFVIIFSVGNQYQLIYMLFVIQLAGNILSVEWMNEAAENYGFITKKTIVVRILYVISIFVFVRTPDDIIPYTLIMSLSVVLNNVVSFLYIKKNIPFDFSDFKLAKYIRPLFTLVIISNVNMLYTKLDQLLLGVGPAANEIAVTEYALPAAIMNMVGGMITSLLMVAVPRLSYYRSKGENNSYMTLLSKSTRGFFLILCPICVGLFCLSYEAMYIYTNGAYAYAYNVMEIFAIRFLITSLYAIFTNQIIYIYGKEHSIIGMVAIGGFLNLFFNIGLLTVGSFTPATAIFSTAIAETIMLAILYYYIRKKLKVPFKVFAFSNMKYLYLTIPFVPVSYIVKSFKLGVLYNCAIIIPICAIFYFGVLMITKDEMMTYFSNKLKLKLKR